MFPSYYESTKKTSEITCFLKIDLSDLTDDEIAALLDLIKAMKKVLDINFLL